MSLRRWILISNIKLAYNMFWRPDDTFNCELKEFLDRKVALNTIQMDGVYSFDVVDSATSLLNRIYWCSPARKRILTSTRSWSLGTQKNTKQYQYRLGINLLPLITHFFAKSAIYDMFCCRLTGLIKGMVV